MITGNKRLSPPQQQSSWRQQSRMEWNWVECNFSVRCDGWKTTFFKVTSSEGSVRKTIVLFLFLCLQLFLFFWACRSWYQLPSFLSIITWMFTASDIEVGNHKIWGIGPRKQRRTDPQITRTQGQNTQVKLSNQTWRETQRQQSNNPN